MWTYLSSVYQDQPQEHFIQTQLLSTFHQSLEALQKLTLFYSPDIDLTRLYDDPVKLKSLTTDDAITALTKDPCLIDQFTQLYDKGYKVGEALFGKDMRNPRREEAKAIATKFVQLGVENKDNFEKIMNAPIKQGSKFTDKLKKGLANNIYQNCTNYTKFGLALLTLGDRIKPQIQLNQQALDSLTMDKLLGEEKGKLR